MAHIEDDFAAYTTLGDRVVPQTAPSLKKPASSQGPKFGVPTKLEPFTLLAKSARGAGAANLISQAVSAPGVYVFNELLQINSIKELATNEQHAKQYKLLELFAYGTWNDYNAARDDYPTLSAEQSLKLKQLTILSLASETRTLPYSILLESLEISTIPELEDLLIESIYSNIFVARLDQQSQQLEILSSLGRDVQSTTVDDNSTTNTAPSMELDNNNNNNSKTTTVTPSIGSLLKSLQEWQSKIDGLLNSLDQHLLTLNANSINQTKKSFEHEQKVRSMVFQVGHSGGKGGGKGGASGSKDTMSSSGGGWGNVTGTSTSTGVGDSSGDMEVDSPTLGSGSGSGGTTRGAMSPSGGVGQRHRKRGRV